MRARTLVAVAAVAVLPVGAPASGAGAAAGPSATAPPSVTGTAAAGRRLTGLTGIWSGTGALAYAFKWHRCDPNAGHCNPIRGATSATYTLVAKDVGKTIGLTVYATDETGTAAAYASLVGPIAVDKPLLVSTARPVISGDPVQGRTVQVTTGVWSPTPERVAYAWLRCNRNGRLCLPIPGASSSSYTSAAADVTHALVARVQASFGTTTQSALSSATTAVVSASVVGPATVVAPTVRGTAVEGHQLVASAGTWSGLGELAYAYQWYRCDTSGAHCTSIRGATAAAYRLAEKDVGRTLGLRVAATDVTGTARAYASLLGPIAPASAELAATGQPAITGENRPGYTLAVSGGAWTYAPLTYAYAWQRCNLRGRVCTAVGGATGPSYLVTAADLGRTLVVVVTARSRTSSQSAYSTATAPIR